MKKIILLALYLLATTTLASSDTYTSPSGCTLSIAQTENSTTYSLNKNGKVEVIEILKDYSLAKYSNCEEGTTEIFNTEGSVGSGLMIFCDESTTMRSIVDIEFKSENEVNHISVSSETHGIDVETQSILNISCSNLKK